MSEETALATRPALRRSLQAAAPVSVKGVVKWHDERGTEIALNVPLARSMFKSKYPFTDVEMALFIQQCYARRANPYLGDMYPIKYSASDPAAFVTGYHYLMGQVKKSPDYRGFDLHYVDAEGKRIPDGLESAEKVVAAICQVRITGYESPVKFVARMKDFNKGRAQWTSMPVLMLGKCAIANAHRLADPGLAGMYLPEEVGQGYVTSEDEAPLYQEAIEEAQLVGNPEEPADGGEVTEPEAIPEICAECSKPLEAERRKFLGTEIGQKATGGRMVCFKCQGKERKERSAMVSQGKSHAPGSDGPQIAEGEGPWE